MTYHTYISETMNNKLVTNWNLTAKYGDMMQQNIIFLRFFLLFSRTILRGYKYS